jgi:photosystem II stability/assembly factor-like uncharacterized protein
MTSKARSALFSLFVLLAVLGPEGARAAGFNAVTSTDGTDVWAVGPAGAAYRSLDGGSTWSSLVLGSGDLRDVAARGFTVWIVGDAGKVQRTIDSGTSWSSVTVAGAPRLNAIHMVTDSLGYVVGNGGAIFKTTNFGASWSPQTSGTPQNLYAVRFTDVNHGWAVGASGVMRETTNGGALWSPVTTGTTCDLLALGLSGSVVWAVGRESVALRSLNGGGSWTPVNLKIDSKVDVTGVDVAPGGAVTLTGGGGFIRVSTDNGVTWTFRKHTFQGPASDLFILGSRGWITNSRNHAVLRTEDGANWSVPAGVTLSRSWTQVYPFSGGGIRGSTLCQHGTHLNTLYACLATNVVKSENRGDTWTVIGTIPDVTKTNAFYVSPTDSLLMVAAVNNPDRIVLSVNGGASWTTRLTKDFSEYGVPLEMNVNSPNELFFAPEDGRFYRSLDFGASWDSLSYPQFRSPCDIQVVPDSSQIIWVGDGVTNTAHGQLHRSTDRGLTFQLIYTGIGSEIPMIAGSRLNRALGIATQWSTGGVRRTLDYGASWDSVAGTQAAWGTTISKDDPTLLAYGVAAGGLCYLSFDGGTTFATVALTNFNYSITALDRNTILAEQGNGLYKMAVTYSEPPLPPPASVQVVSPNGGEQIAAGAVVTVSWTATSIPIAKVQYRKAPGQPWTDVARAAGYSGYATWSVPSQPTTQAKIRVFDDADGSPVDSSNAFFSIVSSTTGVPDGGTGAPELTLRSNRPNPFAKSTRISYALPSRTRVKLEVFSVEGRLVATLVDRDQEAGEHTVDFSEDAIEAEGTRIGPLKSGVYFTRLTAGRESRTLRMLLVR